VTGRAADRDWVAGIADTVIAAADQRAPGKPVVCASGLSPSGPIHLGNLREIMVPHFVADEIRRRGRDCVHLLSWDDYDRLRKIPAGLPESFSEHIGRPLSAVPDPSGEYASWAERFKAPLREAMNALGVEVREISQTQMYTAGHYADQVLRALDRRADIDVVLARYRTKSRPDPDGSDDPDAGLDPGGSVDSGPDGGVRGEGYYPYRPYCHACGRDTTRVGGHDRLAATVDYTCLHCGHRGEVDLRGANSGKLVWKVDWPMRWAYEGVVFEPAGADHSSPGSSFTVGSQLVGEIFDAEPPVYLGFTFVGIRGMGKMSSSAGAVPTPGDALRLLEAPVLRWLFARRLPKQEFTIDFGPEVARLCDEWDRLKVRVAGGTAAPWERAVLARSEATARGRLPEPAATVSFRTLAAVLDVTAGDEVQLARVLRTLDTARPDLAPDQLQPRLGLARTWVSEQVPPQERTQVRTEPDESLLTGLDARERNALDLLVDLMEGDWTLDGLTRLVYGVPKIQYDMSLDAEPTPEVKQAQKQLFRLLYRLLVGADRGPRLPTLLLSLGPEPVRRLLGRTSATGQSARAYTRT
jgi:lysyl-tRNA synthetase, class I